MLNAGTNGTASGWCNGLALMLSSSACGLNGSLTDATWNSFSGGCDEACSLGCEERQLVGMAFGQDLETFG